MNWIILGVCVVILIIIVTVYIFIPRREINIERYTLTSIDDDILKMLMRRIYPKWSVFLTFSDENPSTINKYLEGTEWEIVGAGSLISGYRGNDVSTNVIIDSSVTTFTKGTTYGIKDEAGLKIMSNIVNNSTANSGEGCEFYLLNDIEISAIHTIGDSTHPFQGKFYGNSHLIKLISSCDSTGGLFGNVGYDSIISGLVFTTDNNSELTITPNNVSYAGALCDYCEGLIVYSFNYVKIKFVFSEYLTVFCGGICGHSETGTILNCRVFSSIVLETTNRGVCGGVCGEAIHTYISSCVFQGTIDVQSDSNAYMVGNIIGASTCGYCVNCYGVYKGVIDTDNNIGTNANNETVTEYDPESSADNGIIGQTVLKREHIKPHTHTVYINKKDPNGNTHTHNVYPDELYHVGSGSATSTYAYDSNDINAKESTEPSISENHTHTFDIKEEGDNKPHSHSFDLKTIPSITVKAWIRTDSNGYNDVLSTDTTIDENNEWIGACLDKLFPKGTTLISTSKISQDFENLFNSSEWVWVNKNANNEFILGSARNDDKYAGVVSNVINSSVDESESSINSVVGHKLMIKELPAHNHGGGGVTGESNNTHYHQCYVLNSDNYIPSSGARDNNGTFSGWLRGTQSDLIKYKLNVSEEPSANHTHQVSLDKYGANGNQKPHRHLLNIRYLNVYVYTRGVSASSNKGVEINVEEVEDDEGEDIEVIYDEYDFILDKSISEFESGKSYGIDDESSLERLAELVNNGVSTSGIQFDIIKNFRISEFPCIGTSEHPFSGTFDGHNATLILKSTYVPSSNGCGLFSHVSSATISNITIKSVNADVFIDAEDIMYIGSICGYAKTSTIKNCSNYVKIISNESYIGGICGMNETKGSISGCNNYAEINGKNYVGGICGYVYSCDGTNKGLISGKGNYIGGIVGYTDMASRSYNYSTIIGKNTVGGIAGYCRAQANSNENNGDVYASGENAGGICGEIGYSNGTKEVHLYVQDNTNNGNIYCDKDAGGIYGYYYKTRYTYLHESNNINNGTVYSYPSSSSSSSS